MPKSDTMGDDRGNRFQVLCYEQVERLHRVMETSVPIHGRGNFPTLEIKLKDLIQVVQTKLRDGGIQLRDIRLNGGAASYILADDATESYNDLDLIFGTKLGGQADLQRIKDLVMESLLDFLPRGVSKERMTGGSLNEAYVHKMVKIYTESDRWSLISLSNARGRNVELKFADTMRRQFEFSVDSFQILLDSLLTFYDVSRAPIAEHFYPTVVAESVFGSFDVALSHLNRKLIATRNPEEIRGGGLLKYCNLLVRDYKPTRDCDVRLLERYMCSRFFIDFSDVSDQRTKLSNYLADHFIDDDEEELRYRYLQTLYAVVEESTVCLMGHERRLTLELIRTLSERVLRERERRAYDKAYSLGRFEAPGAAVSYPSFDPTTANANLIIDQVYYGPFTYPTAYPGAEPQHYYTVYTYEYNSSGNLLTSSASSPALSPAFSSSSSSSSSSCPYCDSCSSSDDGSVDVKTAVVSVAQAR